jgi:hypothetical protein
LIPYVGKGLHARLYAVGKKAERKKKTEYRSQKTAWKAGCRLIGEKNRKQ